MSADTAWTDWARRNWKSLYFSRKPWLSFGTSNSNPGPSHEFNLSSYDDYDTHMDLVTISIEGKWYTVYSGVQNDGLRNLYIVMMMIKAMTMVQNSEWMISTRCLNTN